MSLQSISDLIGVVPNSPKPDIFRDIWHLLADSAQSNPKIYYPHQSNSKYSKKYSNSKCSEKYSNSKFGENY